MLQSRKHINYLTTNLVNDMIYIGVHLNKKIDPYEFDGYLGSGVDIKQAIKEFGRNNFKRETLFVFDTKQEVKDKERELVSPEFVKLDTNYNRVKGGGGWSSNKGRKFTEEHKRKISENSGRRLSEEEVILRLKDIKVIEKKLGWKKFLANKWGLNHVTVLEFIQKYATNINVETDVVLKQREQDVINIEKRVGWRKKLAKKWGVHPTAAGQYIRNHFGYVDFKSPTVVERLRDIQGVTREFGWIKGLSDKWGITDANAGKFIKRYASEVKGL